jgi:hypothetical protein
MRTLSLLAIVLLLLPTVFAHNATNSTQSALVGWSSGSNNRGTLDLVWGCLSTLFVCVWTVLHLDIPHVRLTKWKIFERKLAYMAATSFTPEYITATALSDYISAKHSVYAMKAIGHEHWEMVHAHYADMGGIRVVPENRQPFFPTANDMYILVKTDTMDLPHISKFEIEDKSKADHLAKAIACFSAIWLTVQVVGRAVVHLPITAMELVTVAFVACTLISYGLWWYKPLDITFLTTVPIGEISEDVWSQFEIIRDEEDKPSWLNKYLSERLGEKLGRKISRPFFCFTVWADVVDSARSIYLALCLVGVFFGAIHCIAWDFSFPSPRERLLWRIFSITAAGIPGAFYVIGIYCRAVHDTHVPDTIYFPFFVVYFVARMYLWFETFASLKSVPKGVYDSIGWMNYVPHF